MNWKLILDELGDGFALLFTDVSSGRCTIHGIGAPIVMDDGDHVTFTIVEDPRLEFGNVYVRGPDAEREVCTTHIVEEIQRQVREYQQQERDA